MQELALVVVVVVVSLGVLVVSLVLLGGVVVEAGMAVVFSTGVEAMEEIGPVLPEKEEVDGDNADETVNGVWVVRIVEDTGSLFEIRGIDEFLGR